jgi:long-subunit fatty acid transport protein
VFFPELKLNYKIFDNISVWAGFGLMSASGETPGLGEKAKSNQNIISFGVGYSGDFTPKLGYKVEAGAAYFSYKEEALELKVTGSAFGFSVDAGIVFNITDAFFAEVLAGFISANDTVIVEGEGVDIKLGGLKAGVGIGIRF